MVKTDRTNEERGQALRKDGIKKQKGVKPDDQTIPPEKTDRTNEERGQALRKEERNQKSV